MDWFTLFRTVLLPLLIKLLQGVMNLPPEQFRAVAEHMMATDGSNGDAFSAHTPQPGEQFPYDAAGQSPEQMGAQHRQRVQPPTAE